MIISSGSSTHAIGSRATTIGRCVQGIAQCGMTHRAGRRSAHVATTRPLVIMVQRVRLRADRIAQHDACEAATPTMSCTVGIVKCCGVRVIITQACGITTRRDASATSRLAFGRLHRCDPHQSAFHCVVTKSEAAPRQTAHGSVPNAVAQHAAFHWRTPRRRSHASRPHHAR